MKQYALRLSCLMILAALACCNKDEDAHPATCAVDGLMPGSNPDPQADALYIEDQSKIKLATAREVSYEPLESFRGTAPKQVDVSAPAAKPSEESPVPESAARAAPPRATGGGSFWTRVGMKAMMGGGGPAAGAGSAAGGESKSAADEEGDNEPEESEEGESDDSEEEEEAPSDEE